MKALNLIALSLTTFVAAGSVAKTKSTSKSTSEYTSIASQGCETIEHSANDPNPEIDYYTGLCAGKDGFTVKISGGDLHYSLSLIHQGQEVEITRTAAIHNPGSDKIEWRGQTNKKGSVGKFHSLIYRLNVNDDYDPATGTVRARDLLYVVRLNGTKSCLIGIVPPSEYMNQVARTLADEMSVPCLAQD